MSTTGVLEPTTSGVAPAVAPRLLPRLLGRPIAVVCLAVLGAVVIVAIVAPVVLPHVAGQQAGDLLHARQGPSRSHLLGTDTLGRDVLDRLLVGSRVTILGVCEALFVVVALGVPLGLAAGFFGGGIDRFVGWLADLTFSMPAIVVVIVVLTVFSQSMLAGMLAFGILAAPGLMRVVRSATLPVKEQPYIAAAQVSGLSRPYILRKHVLPRIAGPVIVQAALLAATALLVQSGLAFLGLLVAPPAPSWGGMIANGTSVIELQPWLIWPPGMAIALTILALGLLGDAVRDATTETWSPNQSRRRTRPQTKADVGVVPTFAPQALLCVRGLSVVLPTAGSEVCVVDNVSFDIALGQTVALVGESGCGKTVTAHALLGLLPGALERRGGAIRLNGRDLAGLPDRELRRVRGSEIALVSQEPMVSLDPAYRVGAQIVEAVRQHHHVSRKAATAKTLSLLADVRLPEPEKIARRFPHQLSGGMAQRVGIARALAGEPQLLIADEPTTALDVTIQAEILDLLRDLQASREMAVLFITHDWGVVADSCERALVMYAGQVVEVADVVEVIKRPLHPYTEGLLSASPHAVSQELDTLPTLPGAVPRLGAWPPGCRFAPRCQLATAECSAGAIALEEIRAGRATRCIHSDRLARAGRRSEP